MPAAEADPSIASTAIRFSDVLGSSGIDFLHTDGGGPKQYIIQTVVAGLALFDYDRDGFIDIYFLNSSKVPGSSISIDPANQLYRNNGNWTFTNVTDSAGVGDLGYSLGVAIADYDQDGYLDIYVNNFGPNVFYKNRGDGTFEDHTVAAGIACSAMGAGAVFADVDVDGDLDLYVGNYVDFTYDNYKNRNVGDYEFAAAPQDYDPAPDRLFQNQPDGTFEDISEQSGLLEIAIPSMGVIATDYDGDRDPDIVVCGDNAPNQLLVNDGTGRFEDAGVVAGIAHDLRGNNNGSMGVDAGDYDNDGLIDLYITNYQGELSVLYKNVGGGFYSDVSRFSQASNSSMPFVKWGTGMVDFDLDGDRDLFVACGHFNENIDNLDDRGGIRVPNFILENRGDGRFRDVTSGVGSVLDERFSTKGAGFDDLDNDGDVDVVLLNANDRPSLIRNDTQTTRRAMQIELVGTKSNRDGVGARITILSVNGNQVAEVYSGRGYQSHYGLRSHFGIDPTEAIIQVKIEWLAGATEFFEVEAGDILVRLIEGRGKPPQNSE